MERDRDVDWERRAAICLRIEMARRGVKFPELARRLTTPDRPITPQSLRSRLSRSAFSAAFFLEVLAALHCDSLRLEDLLFDGGSARGRPRAPAPDASAQPPAFGAGVIPWRRRPAKTP